MQPRMNPPADWRYARAALVEVMVWYRGPRRAHWHTLHVSIPKLRCELFVLFMHCHELVIILILVPFLIPNELAVKETTCKYLTSPSRLPSPFLIPGRISRSARPTTSYLLHTTRSHGAET
jgi:hypothetical protein